MLFIALNMKLMGSKHDSIGNRMHPYLFKIMINGKTDVPIMAMASKLILFVLNFVLAVHVKSNTLSYNCMKHMFPELSVPVST
jgi:hypothetical protein